MKWVYDSKLIISQIITWLILIVIWGAVFLLVLLLPGFFMWIGILIMGIVLFIQYFFSDRIVVKLMRARVITETENPHLYNTIKKLAAKAEIPMPKVAIANTPVPNAFATGRNRHHSVVAVTTGILPMLNQDELESVLAHELSHIKNYDMITMTIAGFIASVASALAISQVINVFGNRKSGIGEFFVGLICLVVVAILFVITLFLTRLLSRYREYAADKGSAIITRNPDAMISALNKITNGVSITSSSAGSLPASGNLYYIIPAARSFSLFGMFSTHPTLKRRVRSLEKTKRDMLAGKI